jgi:Fe-S-cluster-containing dehydrogenase component
MRKGNPIEGSGFSAPVVLADKCVGCGLCQTRCHSINVKTKQLLSSVAIVVEAGPGKEDRMAKGSYLALARSRAAGKRRRRRAEKIPTSRHFCRTSNGAIGELYLFLSFPPVAA